VPFVGAIWFFALGADPETGGAVATDMLPCFGALAGGKVASATTPRITDVGESKVESPACLLAERGALAGAESSFFTSTCAQKTDLSRSTGNIMAARIGMFPREAGSAPPSKGQAAYLVLLL